MSDLKSTPLHSNVARAFICVSLLSHAGTWAAAATANTSAEAGVPASGYVLPTRPYVGDDPVAIRDALAAQKIASNAPSLSDRVRKLIHVPSHKTPGDLDLANAHLDEELAFVIPAPYGILYRSKAHQLTVDVDLSGEDDPGVILLKKTVTGPRGRGLVVAPEAKSKGYIQHIDLIELKSSDAKKSEVHGSLTLSPATFSAANGDFAIVLLCNLAPPYLADRSEHTDPTDDEPTDITTRTSTLYADVEAVWLISPQNGIVLSKKLHLSK